MITSPTGSQKVTVHGVGPQTEVMSLSQFRDAVGYSKQTPLPPREVTLSGVLTPGMDTISGLSATDGLVGAEVAGGGLPEGVTVLAIIQSAVPQTLTAPPSAGTVRISFLVPPAPPVDPKAPPVAPAEIKPVDFKFAIPSAPIIFEDGISRLQLTPVEPIPELTVTLPPKPVDGQLAFIYSTLPIAALTMLANIGQTLNWSPAAPKKAEAKKDPKVSDKPPCLALAADTSVGYLYSAPNSTWDRIQ